MGRDAEFAGMYLLLLIAMWENDGQLVDEDDYLQHICHASKSAWLKHRQALANLFFIHETTWNHNGIREQLARSRVIYEGRVRAGKKGGNSKWHKPKEEDF